jgi:formiminoglutamase
MNPLKIYSPKNIQKYISKRTGETKFGESIGFVQELNDLKTAPAKYVLIGIPEDIGVMANQGVPGAKNAWSACLKSILNVQANDYTNAQNLILLGEIDCSVELKAAGTLDKEDEHYYEELGQIVSQLDAKVAMVVEFIIGTGKIPVVIGGGHNNAYGIIKGCAQAFQKPVNVVNFDAHSDFRQLEHRHSGNGFSYAFAEAHLNKYFIFGLQKNYNSQAVLDDIHSKSERVSYNLYECICIKKSKPFGQALKEAESFTDTPNRLGIELDLDSIQDIPSSAITPSGFSVNEARRFVSYFSKKETNAYLHLCEAAPKPGTDEEKQVGKLLAYLIIDFIS